jgi:hypothetical protein
MAEAAVPPPLAAAAAAAAVFFFLFSTKGPFHGHTFPICLIPRQINFSISY